MSACSQLPHSQDESELTEMNLIIFLGEEEKKVEHIEITNYNGMTFSSIYILYMYYII